MTDNEIIKALECCGVNRDCTGCPKEKEPYGCYFVLCGGALDLIKRQKAEIAELQSELIITKNNFDNVKDRYDEAVKIGQKMNEKLINAYKKLQTAKAEAIKEFAARLKVGVPQETGVIRCADIENLLKEMESKTE